MKRFRHEVADISSLCWPGAVTGRILILSASVVRVREPGSANAAMAREAERLPGARPVSQLIPESGTGVRPAAGSAFQSRINPWKHSRTTALVRASERVAPAVVSVNVLREQQVRARSYWDDF